MDFGRMVRSFSTGAPRGHFSASRSRNCILDLQAWGPALTREQSASLWKVTNERLLELKHKHGFELLEFDSANGATAFHNRIDKVSAALGLTAKTEPFYSSDLVNNSGEAEDISSDLRTVYEALQAEASSD